MNEIQNIFTRIYQAGKQTIATGKRVRGSWSSTETVSGVGSELASTVAVREKIPPLFKELNIHRVLDVGCGDFNWMQKLVPGFDYYFGVDVVPALIKSNREKYGSENVHFHCGYIQNMDVAFSDFDIVVLNDVLVHLPFKEIFSILQHLKASGVTYVLMTHFTQHPRNVEAVIGGWRKLRLNIEPFNLPNPLLSLTYDRERHPTKSHEINREARDKTLSLWKFEDIIV